MKMKNFKKALGAGVVVAGASIGQAHAALDASVSTALGEVNADVTTVGGYVIGAAALILTFRMVKRAMGM